MTLSNGSDSVVTFPFSLGGGASGDPAEITDYSLLSFSNNVTYDSNTGLITVPAGVTGFTVTVATTDDTLDENNETVDLSIGGETATGTIVDNDGAPTVTDIELQNAQAEEGVEDLIFNVTLSNGSDSVVTFPFSLGGGASGDPAETTDYSLLSFSNNVTYDSNTGLITVPAGVTGFTVTVATTDDTLDENNETVDLSIGGETATGTIVDNDGAPTVTDIELQNAQAEEGVEDLIFNVTLSNGSDSVVTFPFSLGGGANGDPAEATDYSLLSFSNNVTYDSNTGLITVPAGVTGFTVTVATT
ncbi:hypothetical protein, partial [Endozoicomonas sp. OPT23]|uniref:hypothetical protein n=2 Tax=Endozoicomonas sp. OPT23 TaxID=2072845 RepID=UPI001E3798B5